MTNFAERHARNGGGVASRREYVDPLQQQDRLEAKIVTALQETLNANGRLALSRFLSDGKIPEGSTFEDFALDLTGEKYSTNTAATQHGGNIACLADTLRQCAEIYAKNAERTGRESGGAAR